jgi:hypothetical protein
MAESGPSPQVREILTGKLEADIHTWYLPGAKKRVSPTVELCSATLSYLLVWLETRPSQP